VSVTSQRDKLPTSSRNFENRHALDMQSHLELTSDIVEELEEMTDSEESENGKVIRVTRRSTMDTSLERISQTVRRRVTRSCGMEIWGQTRRRTGVQ
jgi:hypothetical protein